MKYGIIIAGTTEKLEQRVQHCLDSALSVFMERVALSWSKFPPPFFTCRIDTSKKYLTDRILRRSVAASAQHTIR